MQEIHQGRLVAQWYGEQAEERQAIGLIRNNVSVVVRAWRKRAFEHKITARIGFCAQGAYRQRRAFERGDLRRRGRRCGRGRANGWCFGYRYLRRGRREDGLWDRLTTGKPSQAKGYSQEEESTDHGSLLSVRPWVPRGGYYRPTRSGGSRGEYATPSVRAAGERTDEPPIVLLPEEEPGGSRQTGALSWC